MDDNNPTTAYLVFEQMTYYRDCISVYLPNEPILKGSGIKRRILYRNSEEKNTDEEEAETDLERSLRRTRKAIGDYILCNCFDLFATFTFKNNRENIDEKRKQMMNWLKNQRKRHGKFGYLLVPEFHSDKKCLHFHALLSGYPGELKLAINPKNGRVITRHHQPVFSLGEYKLGFTEAQKIDIDAESQLRLSSYVKKYITKDMPLFARRQRYWVSKGLKKPKLEDNPKERFWQNVKPDWEKVLENGRGVIMRFNAGSSDLVDKLLGRYAWD